MGDLTTAATSGDIRSTLVALRDRLAEEIETAKARDLASLSKQLTDVLTKIHELPDATGTSVAEEVARKRQERREPQSDEG